MPIDHNSPLPPPRFSAIGGAQLGWLNATGPLAKLSVDSDRLTISVWLMGRCSFTPAEVVAIEPIASAFGQGRRVRVLHTRRDFPREVIFVAAGGTKPLLSSIEEAGFRPTAAASEMPDLPGFAMRWTVIVPLILLSYIPFLIQIVSTKHLPVHPPDDMVWIVLLYLVLTLGALRSAQMQRWLLKPGRDIGEVRPMLRLLVFVTSIMLVVCTVIYFNRGT